MPEIKIKKLKSEILIYKIIMYFKVCVSEVGIRKKKLYVEVINLIIRSRPSLVYILVCSTYK